MADVDATLPDWSITAASNKPTDATSVGSGVDDNLQTIQAVVRAYLAHYNAAAIASAGTTDLGANTGLFQEISGTNTITSLGTVSAGIWKIVMFQDTLTLTHNAVSLALPTGANIKTKAGDFMLAYSKGAGNWRVTFYSRVYAQSANIASGATINLDLASGDYTHITGAVGCTAITLAQGQCRTTVTDGAMLFTNSASLILLTGANITSAAGDIQIWRGEAAGVVRMVAYHRANGVPLTSLPTRQVFTSGAANWNRPTGCRSINVRMCGAGGGGSGNGAGVGVSGGNTTFSTATASGGTGGNTTNPGLGGAAAGGDIHLVGGGGQGAGQNNVAQVFVQGGQGGCNPFGGAGAGGIGNFAGGNGAANTGAGGGGGGGISSGDGGAGGGAGGYVEWRITSPGAALAYSIGAGGAGAGIFTGGGTGGSGIIIVDEFY